MGIPAAVGMLVNALYNVVDTIFVGHGVGPLAIAALSIVFPIQMIVSALAQAIGVGASSVVSRRLGEKREADAGRTIGTAYSAIGVLTASLVLLTALFRNPILGFFGASPGILPYAEEYLRYVTPGFFFFAASMAASSLVRSEGSARASMTGMLIGALLNCALDPLFIFGFGLGVKGAAIATVISQGASFVYFIALYLLKKTHIPLKRNYFRIRPALLGEAAVLGTPSFIQSAGMSLLALLINTSLGRYGGDEAVSIYGMISRLVMLVIFPILGVVQGFQPIVGYNYGARNYVRVRRTILVTIATVTGISLVSYTLMMVFPRVCMGLFTSDARIIAAAAGVLRIMVLFIPLAAIQIVGAKPCCWAYPGSSSS